MSIKKLLVSGVALMFVACGGASQGPDTETGSSGSELGAPGESLDPSEGEADAPDEEASDEGSADEEATGDEGGAEEAAEDDSSDSEYEPSDDESDDSGDDESYEEDE